MSFFRRKLMEMKSGDKPNLAVITDSTVEVTEFTRQNIGCGLTANLKKGKKYNISCSIDIVISEITADKVSNIYIFRNAWPHNHWINIVTNRYLYREDIVGIPQHIDYISNDVEVSRDIDKNNINLLVIDVSDLKCTIKFSNLVITEA